MHTLGSHQIPLCAQPPSPGSQLQFPAGQGTLQQSQHWGDEGQPTTCPLLSTFPSSAGVVDKILLPSGSAWAFEEERLPCKQCHQGDGKSWVYRSWQGWVEASAHCLCWPPCGSPSDPLCGCVPVSPRHCFLTQLCKVWGPLAQSSGTGMDLSQ